MTIQPAHSKPRAPSHRVEVGGNSLVLLSRSGDMVIFDADVDSIRWQTYAQRPAHFKQRRQPPKFGHHVLTLVHGPDRTETKVTLPWNAGKEDRLEQYRVRVANRISKRILDQLRSRQQIKRPGWSIEGDWLTWQGGSRVQLSQVTDICYFGDEAAIWTTACETPIPIPSELPDQMVLTELLQHYADNHTGEIRDSKLGRTLFLLRHDRRAAIAQRLTRLSSSVEFQLAVASGVVTIFFTVISLIGTAVAAGGFPQDWRRVLPLPLPFVAIFLLLAGKLLFDAAVGLIHEVCRWRVLEVRQRGLVVGRWRKQLIEFQQITNHRIEYEAVYRGSRFRCTEYELHLATKDTKGRPSKECLRWCEPVVGRGEMTFLNEMLHVATTRRQSELPDVSLGTAQSEQDVQTDQLQPLAGVAWPSVSVN